MARVVGYLAAAVGLRRTEEDCRSIPWLRPGHASPQSTGSRAPAPTSAHPGARPQRRCEHVASVHGQWCPRAHFNTSRCPYLAAVEHVTESIGQPCSRAHCNTCRCPPRAACRQVDVFHGHPCSCANFSTSRCPPQAAAEHVSSLHSHPCSRAHCSTSKCPP